MSQEIIEEAADRLCKASQQQKVCHRVSSLIGEHEFQREITKRREANGARVIGRKIGFTSAEMQKEYSISHPVYGTLFDDMDIPLGSDIPPDSWLYHQQSCVETEIAFVLGSDISSERPTTTQVGNAVDHVVAALEIIASRIKPPDIYNPYPISITDIIADNASGGYFVLGHSRRRLHEIDVVNCKMKTAQNGEVVSEGTGELCMGSPLNALRWLAEEMVRAGHCLKAGDVIMSGALGPKIRANQGDKFEGRIESLGNVNVSFLSR